MGLGNCPCALIGSGTTIGKKFIIGTGMGCVKHVILNFEKLKCENPTKVKR